MNYSKLAIFMLLVGHVVCSGIAIYDLFTISKRSKKTSWLSFLIMLPYISVFVYSATKRRPGRSSSPQKINK